MRNLDQEKPLLRGWFHLAAWFACLPGTWWLLTLARGNTQVLAVAVFMGSLLLLFGISSLYHLGKWSESGLARMRRLDHGMIFLSIAGAYTPYCLLALPPAHGTVLLYAIWLGAAAGIMRVLAWPYAPRWAAVGSYAVISCFAAPIMPDLHAHLSPVAYALVWAGFVFAGLGALCYATGRPEPWPRVLGHHEVFHVAVVACMGCYYAGLYTLLGGP